MTTPLVQQLSPPAWQRSLAGFGYRQIAPAPVLAPYVQHYWELSLPAGHGLEHRELLHPDGGSSLLFQLQGCLRVDAQPARQGIVFNAAAAKSGALVLEPGVQVFAVRFRPGMGSVFWRAAASDFANELMGLDCAQYLRFDLPAVTEQLQMAADMLARVLLLEAALGKALAEVAYQAGYADQAHFSHDFKAVVGVTPGQYLRRAQARYHHVESSDAQIVHRA